MTEDDKEPKDMGVSEVGGLVFRVSWTVAVVLILGGMYISFGAFGATPLSGGDIFASLPDFLGPLSIVVGVALFPIGIKLGVRL